MHQDLELYGKVNWDETPGDSMEVKVYNYVSMLEKQRLNGYRINCNRSLGSLSEAQKRLPFWDKDHSGRSPIC